MRNFHLALLSCVTFLLCISCSQNIEEFNFNKEFCLSGGDTLVHDIPTTGTCFIDINDSLLVIQMVNTIDRKLIYFYKKDNGELVQSFGEIGNGPGEFHKSFKLALDNGKQRLIYTDPYKFVHYNIDSILNGNFSYSLQEFNINNYGSKPIYLKDSLFLTYPRGKRYAIVNLYNEDTLFCYDHFEHKSPLDADNDNSHSFLYYRYCNIERLNPQKDKLVSLSCCGLVMEIFDIENGALKRSFAKEYIKPRYAMKSTIEPEEGIAGVAYYAYTTHKYIYGAWSESTANIPPSEIAIFDWHGTPIMKLSFENNDSKEVFAIDESNRTLYAVVKNKVGQLNIVRYDMSHLPL